MISNDFYFCVVSLCFGYFFFSFVVMCSSSHAHVRIRMYTERDYYLFKRYTLLRKNYFIKLNGFLLSVNGSKHIARKS